VQINSNFQRLSKLDSIIYRYLIDALQAGTLPYSQPIDWLGNGRPQDNYYGEPSHDLTLYEFIIRLILEFTQESPSPFASV
jgi:hypothetical protein